MNNGFNELWPTTVYLGKIESADQQLLEQVCNAIFSETDLKTPPSDFQKFDILSDGSEVFQEFRDKIVWPAFEKYLEHWNINIYEFPDRRLRSWLCGAYSGYTMPVHNHSGSPVSAVFYLMTEESQSGGERILMDPRHNANRSYKDQFKPLFENKYYTPKSGEFLMFPSFTYHHTMPFTGQMRLAMPVDLFL